jgi:hypothetical protein
MAERPSNPKMRTAMAIIAVIAWFALLLQLFLMAHNSAEGAVLQAVVNYFSFFTILTNLLVAVATSFPLLAPESTAGRFFLRPSMQSAIAVYIAVVGITYTLLLRHLWNPQGVQKLADVLLHDVVPVLYVAFWAIFVLKVALRWSDAVRWLAYPVVYMGYTLAHGFVSHWWPYYFIDVGALGFPRAMGNAAGMLVVFLGLGLLFVALGRWTGHRMAQSSPDSAASKP